MADSRISDLNEATVVADNDLFVLQQGNEAKKLSGSTLVGYCQDGTAQVYAGTTAPNNAKIWINTSESGEATQTLVGHVEGDTLVLEPATSSSSILSYKDENGQWQGIPQVGVKGTSIASVTTSKSGKTTTITMTFTDDSVETQTFTLTDGQDGQGTVNSVNGVSPTGTNISIDASNVPYDKTDSSKGSIVTVLSKIDNRTTIHVETPRNGTKWTYTKTEVDGVTYYDIEGYQTVVDVDCSTTYGNAFYNVSMYNVILPVELSELYFATGSLDSSNGLAFISPKGINPSDSSRLQIWFSSVKKMNSENVYLSGTLYMHVRGKA